MHEIILLTCGHSVILPTGTLSASATVTLIKGAPNVIVDTGDVWQRQEIVDALAAHGVTPSAIAYVVITHGHLDHVGNNNLFPHATFLLDTDVARDGKYLAHDFARGSFLIASGDGGAAIEVIGTAGHTDHDLSVIVRTANGIVAIVGDLFEYEGDWMDNAWRAWSKDPATQQASRDNVLALADYIVPGHGNIFRVPGTPEG